jgi:CheY-like chemotaxis protein
LSTLELPPTCPTHALIADDSDEHRWLVEQMLQPMGFDVVHASDGRHLFWQMEALRHGEVHGEWLVLTDVRMPVYGGLDVLEAWRDRQEWPAPVVVMTAFPDESTTARVRSLGGFLLAKPFSLHQLRKTLFRACTAALASP